MVLNFYKNHSDKRVINKNLSLIKSTGGIFKDDVSILDPVLIISYDEGLLDCNYVYIQDTNRYYYITDMTTSKQRLIITCHVDVLQSWKDEILYGTGIVSRSADLYNKYLPDSQLETYAYKLHQTKLIDSPFTKNLNFILSVVGG